MDSNIPIISIIIPVFDTEKYLARCLESVINQNIKNIEIIICNDMSTDHSEEIILEYVNQYDYIKYFKMKSKGLAGGTRNLGLENVSGKFIGFVDSDDWIDPTMFEEMINLCEKSNADIAVCGVITEYDDSSVMRYQYKLENVIDGKIALELLTRQPNQDISISAIVCNKMYRTQFIKDHHYAFMMNNFNDDDVFNFLCFLNVDKVAIVPNTYYHYYQRQGSLMHHFSRKHIDDLIEGFSVIKRYLDSINCYESYKTIYYAYFEKTLASVLNVLMVMETDIAKQNEYINYLFAMSRDILISADYINYFGVQRIKRFLTPVSA
jgi:glycosyltransferase involved in cell wall biosynthesis